MSEPRDIMVRRLHMRSMRRGIKEMDLILSAFATAHLGNMDVSELQNYDALLAENDHDIYGWICGLSVPPAQFSDLIGALQSDAHGLTRPQPA